MNFKEFVAKAAAYWLALVAAGVALKVLGVF